MALCLIPALSLPRYLGQSYLKVLPNWGLRSLLHLPHPAAVSGSGHSLLRDRSVVSRSGSVPLSPTQNEAHRGVPLGLTSHFHASVSSLGVNVRAAFHSAKGGNTTASAGFTVAAQGPLGSLLSVPRIPSSAVPYCTPALDPSDGVIQ